MQLRHSILLLSLALTTPAFAQPEAPKQQAPKPEPAKQRLNLVMPSGPGRIALPADPDLTGKLITAYDDGQRPVAQLTSNADGIDLSYILFPNHSGDPTGKGCREDVLAPLLKKFGSSISHLDKPAPASAAEPALFTAAYSLDPHLPNSPAKDQNLFGFYGDANTCLEIHISKIGYQPSDQPAMNAYLATLKPDLAYKPTPHDYFLLATAIFRAEPAAAAPYYRTILKLIPVTPDTLTPRRVVTDQLAMSLGIGGKFKESRTLLDSAIAADPDYPLYYYNLACADAEQGDAANARLHLQQAFDRKANTLKGEPMPDPTKDGSLLKLKNNKSFWEYATSLAPPSK